MLLRKMSLHLLIIISIRAAWIHFKTRYELNLKIVKLQQLYVCQ